MPSSSDAPLLHTDVLVIGGGFAGVAAACAAAEAGAAVCLLERRTYLGAEVTATLRPWMGPGQLGELRDLFGWAGEFAGTPAGDEVPLVPAPLKIALEERLLAAGARLLYSIRPISWRHEAGRYHVEVAGKFGRGLVTALVLVDACEAAPVGRLMAGARRRPVPPAPVLWRTMEWTGVDLERLHHGPALPREVAAAMRFHHGHASDQGHVLAEHAFYAEFGSGDAHARMSLEIQARFATMKVARWLRREHAAFAGAKLTATAHEVLLPPHWRLPAGQSLLGAGVNADVDDEAAVVMAADPAALARNGWSAGCEAAARAAENAGVRTVPDTGSSRSAVVPAPVPERRRVDVLVIGGGTSGVSAALGAAHQGATALLAEMNPGLGGTGTVGGVDSYWFGRRAGFNRTISDWVAEEHEWMGWKGNKWNIEAKMFALLKGTRAAGVDVLLHTVLVTVRRSPEGQVTGALVATPDGLIEVEAAVTVDATGDGDAALQAGAKYVYGSDRESMHMWYSMAPYLRPGISKNNFTSTVDVGHPFDYTRAILAGRRRLIAHDHGPYVAPRESRHVIGDVRITLTDLLTMRRWPDVVNIHFSNHDMKGQNTSDWLRMGLLPPNLEAEIPYGALLPQEVEGLLVAGKAFSATHDALPPLRMQADLENLGYVCGIAAGMSAARGVVPRRLPVRELQELLAGLGLLPVSVLTRPVQTTPPSEADLQNWVMALRDDEPLFLYGETDMSEVRRDPIPMVMVCTAGTAILPLLRKALEQPERRLMAARALAWHGDTSAAPVLLEAIRTWLQDGEAPPRTANIRYVLPPPDHGAMPECCYLLHSLAMVRDERAIPVLQEVAEKLNPSLDKIKALLPGTFYYVDAVCDVAERLGHPGCLPALRRLHDYSLFNGKVSADAFQPDWFEERLAYLEIVIGRAMARCGSGEGIAILISYLGDSRRILVRHALKELQAITGQNLPPDQKAWRAWAVGITAWPCRPWIGPHVD